MAFEPALAFVHASELEEAVGPSWTAGHKFRDCAGCPEMVVVPSGNFMMGSPESEEGRHDSEGPVHEVTFERPFAVGVYEVTFGEWDACVSGGGCGGYRPEDHGLDRGRFPVLYVNWEDAKAYVEWLSRKTGYKYRLLSESEWEYVARAGTTTRYWWGDEIGRNRLNCYDTHDCGDSYERRAPVGSFSANPFGLYDMHGNVLELVEDCWNETYHGAPVDGSAWESGNCEARVLRGGMWYSMPRHNRSAWRGARGIKRSDGTRGPEPLRRFPRCQDIGLSLESWCPCLLRGGGGEPAPRSIFFAAQPVSPAPRRGHPGGAHRWRPTVDERSPNHEGPRDAGRQAREPRP